MAASSTYTLPSDVEDEDCVEGNAGGGTITLPSDDDVDVASDIATICTSSYSRGQSTSKKQVGNKRRRLLTLRASPPAHPETTPSRVEVSREVQEQRGGQLS